MDMILLVKRVYALENGIEGFEEDVPALHELMQSFFALTVFESLRRKDLISLDGDGKLKGDTEVSLTADGQTIQNALKTKGLDKSSKN